MAYICYIHQSRTEHVPYMEVLAAASVEEARVRAFLLLRERPHCDRAELWEDDALIDSFGRNEMAE